MIMISSYITPTPIHHAVSNVATLGIPWPASRMPSQSGVYGISYGQSASSALAVWSLGVALSCGTPDSLDILSTITSPQQCATSAV